MNNKKKRKNNELDILESIALFKYLGLVVLKPTEDDILIGIPSYTTELLEEAERRAAKLNEVMPEYFGD